MKNKIKYALILIAISLVFISCGSKTEKNEYGCFVKMADAVENAKKTDQTILLIVTTGEDDPASKSFIDNVMSSPDFEKEITKKFTTVNFDFSEASYQKTVVKEDATAEEQKAAEAFSELMYENARYASMLNVQAAPAVFLLTKQKYYIDEVVFEKDPESVSDFAALLSDSAEKIDSVNLMAKETESGSAEKRLTAIDSLYESTDANFKQTLEELINKAVELDKNNQYGYLSKYLLAKANTDASNLFLQGDVAGAVNCFTEAAKNEHMEPAHKQQMYYMAAYVLAMSGSNDYGIMIEYLQNSINAYPDSENVEGILMFQSYIQAMLEE